jgi:hypothetical protein
MTRIELLIIEIFLKMKLKILILLISFSFISCVSKSEHESLEKELEETKVLLVKTNEELSNFKEKFKELNEEKRQAELSKNTRPYITKTEAIEYVKDYYAFYDNDKIYRNAKFRRVEKNVFKVSLEECFKNGRFKENDFFWDSKVRTLTVNNNDTYSLL